MNDELSLDDLILMVARLYHVDGLSQANVARLANISQAKVSRMLAKARERGFVQITVAEYDSSDHHLEEELTKRLGIRRAKVVKTAAGISIEELRQSVTHFAAPWVAELIGRSELMAISGGRTMRWLAHSMSPPSGATGLTVVQAMGNIDHSDGRYDALDLGRIIAQRWNGTFLTLNTPAILPDAEVRKTLLALDSVRSVMTRLRSAKIALVGVGTTQNSVFVERGVLKKTDTDQLVKAGAVGEICGRFFDRDGNECDTPFCDRVVTIELDNLRRMQEVVAIVVGDDRAEAIRGALRGGLIKSLVIDQQGANALLDVE